ncbi:MAG TPA: thiamine pyrophosphate-dependent enzyme, partial [Bacteroidia bacterium]|nr:thiamine pyrophosphate-dependent enzyme [Bacteroidia bacterium]
EKYLGTKNVTVCYMGDGATRQGALHETFNMAMTWLLPVVYIIENNNYAMGTSVERTSNVQELYKLGLSYDMPSEPVDGMSVEAVHEAMERAVNHARSGKGPYLLEINTYRYKGHSMSDPAKYRTKEEVEEYKAKDPIEQVLITIRSKKYATEAEIETINTRVRDTVEDSVKFAEESPWPDPAELYTDVYVQADYPYIKE